jgi:preprotein translocase SecF subunit
MSNGNFLTRINYMRSAKYWIIFSVVLSIISLIALFGKGLNTGIDFTGGDVLDVQFTHTIKQGDLDNAIEQLVGKNYQTQKTTPKGNVSAEVVEYMIKTPEMKPETRTQLLKNLDGVGSYTIVGEENVSGAVSKELTQKAALALLAAALLQVIYIWIRFDFKFGVTAVAALLHDTIITMGMLAIFRVQIQSAFVAAILTVLGYSMNDTVVVIDRIRENLHKRKKGETLEAMTTRSIQEVIYRSLFTGVSVQMMLVAMLVWGGDSIWDMAMTLLIGITAGTYSSIFIASALWLFWRQWEDLRHKAAKGKVGSKPVKA